MHYVAVIDKDTDSAYGVRFPDLPGCFSAADTFDEIMQNAIEALSLVSRRQSCHPGAWHRGSSRGGSRGPGRRCRFDADSSHF